MDNLPSGTLLFVVAHGREDGFTGFPKVTHASLTYISLAKACHRATSNFKGQVKYNPPLCPKALKVLMFYPFDPHFSYFL